MLEFKAPKGSNLFYFTKLLVFFGNNTRAALSICLYNNFYITAAFILKILQNFIHSM